MVFMSEAVSFKTIRQWLSWQGIKPLRETHLVARDSDAAPSSLIYHHRRHRVAAVQLEVATAELNKGTAILRSLAGSLERFGEPVFSQRFE